MLRGFNKIQLCDEDYEDLPQLCELGSKKKRLDLDEMASVTKATRRRKRGTKELGRSIIDVPEGEFREVQIRPVRDLESDYPPNSVFTTKYTWWNLVFKNLWEQFRRCVAGLSCVHTLRIANLYFLLVVAIQLIPGLSPLSPVASITPLLFVLGTTMLKDGYEDYVRYQSCLY